MENASKALIMSAGLLIGVIVVSFFTYIIATFGSRTSEVYKEKERQQLSEINTQFTIYNKRNDLTIHDVITIANCARENNTKYDFGNLKSDNLRNNSNYMYISVYLKPKSASGSYIEGNRDEAGKISDITNNNNTLIQKDLGKLTQTNPVLPKYSCEVKISEKTQLVYSVILNQM